MTTDKTRLMIVVTPLTGRGGIIRRLSLWGPQLSKHFDVVLLCYCLQADIIQELQKKLFRVVQLTALGRLGRLSVVPAMAALRKELMRYRPAAVISMFLWADLITALTLKTFTPKIPHLIHIAGEPVPSLASAPMRRMYERMVAFSLNQARRIISVSHCDAQKIVREYAVAEKSVQVIPIGIDISNRTRKPAVPVEIHFGVVSRLDPEKMVDLVVQTLFEIKKETSHQFRLEVYGDGATRGQLVDLTRKLGMDNEVGFHGWVQDPTSAFDKIDCLLLFSRNEGTPRSIMEAALRGVPTIARDVGGVGEVIRDGHTGFLVNSIDQLKDRMLSILKAPEQCLELGHNACSFISSRHAIDAETEQIRQLVLGTVG